MGKDRHVPPLMLTLIRIHVHVYIYIVTVDTGLNSRSQILHISLFENFHFRFCYNNYFGDQVNSVTFYRLYIETIIL